MIRPTTTPLLASTALALFASACAFSDDGVEDSSLEAYLESRVFLDLSSSSKIGVCAYNADGRELPYVEPTVAGGRAVLRSTADGWLLVEDLEVELDDVTIPMGELGEEPIVLTDVKLHLGTQIDAQPVWSGDGEAVWGSGDADLLLDWSWKMSNGDVYPLATQRLGEAEFTVAVMRAEDGLLTAQVHTTIPGQVHELTGLVTFRDLSISVDAVTPYVY